MTAAQKKIIREAVHVMLKPLVRFCLHYSFKLKDVQELLKETFVQVAADELLRAGKEISVSRVHVMTGVHRIETGRILQGRERQPRTLDIVTKVIGQWQQDPRFRTKGGQPRALGVEGADSDFVQLVHSVSLDLNPYTVLFEMERVGFINRNQGMAELQTSMYLSDAKADGYALLADDVADLMNSVEENIRGENEQRNLHIKTEYDGIPEDKVGIVRNWIRKEGSQFHAKVRDFLAQYDQDINPKQGADGKRVRVAIGSFSLIAKLNPKSTKSERKG